MVTADFLGIKVSGINKEEIIDRLYSFAKEPGKKTAFYLNAHCVNVALSDPDYLKILNHATLVYPGGQGIIWGARVLGLALPERTNIIDFFEQLTEKLKADNLSLYLLGGDASTVQEAKDNLQAKGLKVVASRSGFFDKEEEARIVREINSLRPNILMLGLGVPKQEKWISAHLEELDVNLCWGVGGFFKIAAGKIKKTPPWISACALEWLYLCFYEPQRLFSRYLFGNPLFVWRVIISRFRQRN